MLFSRALEPKNFLLYFPEDRTCSVLPRSKLVEGSNGSLQPGSEVKAKWSDRGQKPAIYKAVIVNSDGKPQHLHRFLMYFFRD